jgi:hypothetical protein
MPKQIIARSTVSVDCCQADGTLYPELSLGISDGMSNYSNFTFTKGVSRLEDLSIIWSQPNDADEDGTYAHDIYGAKLLVSDENTVSSSGKQKLLALEEGRTLDFMDTRVDPSAGVLDFVLLLTEESGQSTLASATAEYKNAITAESDFSYADLLPGLIMPVLFTVRNDGVDTVTGLTMLWVGKALCLTAKRWHRVTQKLSCIPMMYPKPLSMHLIPLLHGMHQATPIPIPVL